MGELGLLGSTIHGYGCAGTNYVSYGLIAREIERVDSGYRSTLSVQSSLVMFPIFTYGTDEQRERFLPRLATGETVGCFGLTEPLDHGSDPGSMTSRAAKVAGMATVSTVPRPGFPTRRSPTCSSSGPRTTMEKFAASSSKRAWRGWTAPKITDGKFSLRASSTGMISMSNVFVPDANLLRRTRARARRSVRLSQPRALRDRLGRARRRANSAGMRRANTRSSARSSGGPWRPTS